MTRSSPAASRVVTRRPSSAATPVEARRALARAASARTASWTPTSLALLGVVGVLTCVGLVMVLSASSVYSLRQHGSYRYVFQRQLMWVAVGAVLMFATTAIPYRWWRRLGPWMFGLSMFGCLLVVATPLGVTRNGSTRWIGVPGFEIQPSEFVKLGIAIVLADLLSRRAHRMHLTRVTMRPAIVITLTAVAMIMLQPDMGTTMIVVVVAASIGIMSGLPARALLRAGLVATGAALVAGWAEPYRRERLLSFLDGGADAAGTGYHLRQSLVGMVSGRLFGMGLGASRSKWGFLPNAHTDFIFAVIGEELGLVGCLLVVSLVFAQAVLGLVAARRAPDRFGLLLATGITCWITAQAVINIGAVIGIMPITGVPLPYVSVGGSSLVVVMAATGVLLNIARHGVSSAARSVVSVDDEPLPSGGGPDVLRAERRHPAGATPRPGLRHPTPPPRPRGGHRRSAAPSRHPRIGADRSRTEGRDGVVVEGARRPGRGQGRGDRP